MAAITRAARPIILFACLFAAWAAVSAQPGPPKLAVIIVVDQMRADYVEQFREDWSGGLKRLVTEGAWFSRAAYPYLNTVTCSGHATIGTGAFPNVHGVFQNAWFDRDKGRLITCTEDATVRAIGYGKDVEGGESAAQLRVPSFAEEMQRQRGAKVVSLSLKARSAIMLAGHRGDAVTWLADSVDRWETSSAFSPEPVSQVRAFVDANPIESDAGRTWDRILPAERHANPDDVLGEAAPPGWTISFPHVVGNRGSTGQPSPLFYAQWERSPFADAFLGRMAAALVESLGLGTHPNTDVLTVSFSSPDLVGHGFGPRSREVREMFVQLDRTLGLLLERLDALVGRDQYVLALSADHGITDIPEQLIAAGKDGGRINSVAIAQSMEQAARASLGRGNYLAHIVGNDVYLEPGAFDRMLQAPDALRSVMAAAASRPGIDRVFDRAELARPESAASSDQGLRAAALSYAPGRSGDFVLSPKAGWMIGAIGTTHGSASADDQRVPVIFFGKGIKPGQYEDAATPADIAPTLAALCDISLPHAQGKALQSALATNPAPTHP